MIHSYKNKIKNLLEQYDEILFALFFGSCVSGKHSGISDLDIGISCQKPLDLIQLGKIILEIEKISNRKIDLIELNELYNKSPLLAYNIITNNSVIFQRNECAFVDFKRKTFLSYFDTERLRKMVRESFYERISTNKFGKRNYA
jgi:predicted nucleotidyltransferase